MRPAFMLITILLAAVANCALGLAKLARAHQQDEQNGDDPSLLSHSGDPSDLPKHDTDYYGHDLDQSSQESSSSSIATNHNQISYSPSSNSPNSDNNIMDNSFNFKNRLSDKEYLTHGIADDVCRLNRGFDRKHRLNNTYLSYCTRYKLEDLLSNEVLMSLMHNTSSGCDKILDEFIQLDELINQFDLLFKNLLTRYNCHNGYSVKWSCDDCKRAYKDWLCATNLPYYMNGERIKPCISFCERVEQRCPYLHPITKEQYGGQPVFICRDPNIPFVPAITPDIPYSEPSKCYDLCHLTDNLTELMTDSLSKYIHERCPNRNSIAEEVHNELQYCKQESRHRCGRPRKPHLGNSGPIDDPLRSANETDVSHEDTRILDYEHFLTESHVHRRKLNELKDVLIIYKSQPKTHKFGHYSEHSSIEHSQART